MPNWSYCAKACKRSVAKLENQAILILCSIMGPSKGGELGLLSSVSKLRCDAPEDEKLHLIGCHRVVSPAETVDRIRPLMPRMGITRTADVTGLDRIGVPVVMVTRPNAKSLAVSQGKGLDLMAATASGLMESVELFHAEHIELPLKLGSHRQLSQSHAMVDIDHLAHVHPQKFHDNLDRKSVV